MLPNLETVTFTRETPINVGDVLRNAYGEDLIIVYISRRKRKSARIETIVTRINGGTGEMYHKREMTDYPYSYEITFNRSI